MIQRSAILFLVASVSALIILGRGAPVTPTVPVAAAPRTVTMVDNGGTIALRLRDRLLIKLGADWDWTLDPFDEALLKDVTGSEGPPSGAQALLEAVKAGKTKLSLTGDPPCAKSQPPCNLQSRQFKVTIVIQ